MVNPRLIQTVVISHDRPANKVLSRWLSKSQLDWRYSSYDYDVAEVRNQCIKRFLDEDVCLGKQYLMLIDDDMVPTKDSRRILTMDGDLLYCGTAGPMGTPGHYGDDDFGENFFRVSYNLLCRMGYPYFRTQYRQGERVACDGRIFFTQAKTLGFSSSMVSTAGHMQQCVLFPSSKSGHTVAWPYQFLEE